MSQFYRFALVGDPVTHSRSPQIHQAALSLAGLEGNYRAITADRVLLERALSDLASGDLKGVNVTMPLKRAAYELCDETTSEARDAGSVNTLRAENGAIRGHSTDAVSFKDLFDREDLKDLDSFLILGAGGSAAAAVSVAGERSLYVSARDEDQAHALVEDLDAAAVIPWGTAVVGALVINATPLGMSDERLPNAVLDVAGGLVDLPYGGGVTPAVFSMSERGCPVVDGFEFLARQAAESFHWWTGVAVDFAVLTEIARNV